MPSDKPINLNHVRKERKRAEARKDADRNAAYHGLTKAQKQAAKREAARGKASLDGKKQDPDA